MIKRTLQVILANDGSLLSHDPIRIRIHHLYVDPRYSAETARSLVHVCHFRQLSLSVIESLHERRLQVFASEGLHRPCLPLWQNEGMRRFELSMRLSEGGR